MIINLPTTITLILTLAAVVIALGAIGAGVRFAWRVLVLITTGVDTLVDISRQFKPDSGTSLKDVLDAQGKSIETLTGQIAEITAQLAVITAQLREIKKTGAKAEARTDKIDAEQES